MEVIQNQELRRIVWIASFPKSGSTWFRAFLSNILSIKTDEYFINNLIGTPMASSRRLFDFHTGVSSSELTEMEIDSLRPLVYKNIATKSEDNIFIKVHESWRKTLGGYPLFPPEVTKGVIYIIRNPLDIVISYAHHSSKKYGEIVKFMNDPDLSVCKKPDRLYNQLPQLYSDWSGHVTSWVDSSGLPLLTIRYEDMLNDDFNIFSKTLDFIGLQRSKKEIEIAIYKSNFTSLVEMEKKIGFREKPVGMKNFFRQGYSGEWQNVLDNSTIKEICNSHYQIMERFGYNNCY